MLSLSSFQALAQSDYPPEEVSGLTDIRGIEIDKAKSPEERLSTFLACVNNPYQFRVGDVPVNIRFNSAGKKLDIALRDWMCAD